jgi:hypothetical protein
MAAWTEGEGGIDDDAVCVVAEPVEVACEEDDLAPEAAAAACKAGERVDVDVELHAAGMDEDDMVSPATAATGLPAADDGDEDGVAVAVWTTVVVIVVVTTSSALESAALVEGGGAETARLEGRNTRVTFCTSGTDEEVVG